MKIGRNQKTMNICDFPDEIVREILSNLPTKDAVRTSALSKRWIDQWNMDISTIDLEERGYELEKRQQFIQFVERLLLMCEPSHIKKFSLAFRVDNDVHRVNEWISGFINTKIQDINIDVGRVQQPLALPDHLFISETLVKFTLCMKHVLSFPSTIGFSNLKVLTLKDIIFPGTGSTQQFFSSFPSLEELSLIDCNWMNVKGVSIACALLRKFIIRELKDHFADVFNGPNGPKKCHILITGSNLRTFSYDGDLLNDYFLYGTPSVKDATIGVKTWNGGFFVFKLLTVLSNVEKLSFLDFAIEALCRTHSLMLHLPLFQSLVELHLGSSGTPTLFPSEALMALFRKAPILRAVSFARGVSLPPTGENNIGPLPVCFETHLNTIKIYNFSGMGGELSAIQFMLQNALVLDEIYIYVKDHEFDYDAGKARLRMLRKHIQKFPKAAANCVIIFD